MRDTNPALKRAGHRQIPNIYDKECIKRRGIEQGSLMRYIIVSQNKPLRNCCFPRGALG